MITAENVERVYPGKVPTHALRGVSFEVAAGEFVAVMGRSGSGKSTLLHQLGLIDTPTNGRIVIDGVDTLALTDSKRAEFRLRHLGYVFQEFALVVELSALENVCLPAMAAGHSRNEYLNRGRELLGLVGLDQRVHHYPNELSGGEQQRVAVARALINEPKIIFADEPTASLDTVSARQVLDLFRTLNEGYAQTIIMVTDEQEDERFVDRVMWLTDGELAGDKVHPTRDPC